ncbi:F-box domain protein [Aspergillus vadensis CBS 113365]|uniref:F-box domain protein n=1 Tax=Aspergillus vadensis (strain CBS 113365 / IMI 142717 / IBT 24658) TaxID=1448311 RepID=A0A319B2G0_ASPVC|nr:F-box domain protein [Aspergillus vadensis CBS 113365]PYH65921.1 F-box domain protein [Aspergillus vadensis CBS 113365]
MPPPYPSIIIQRGIFLAPRVPNSARALRRKEMKKVKAKKAEKKKMFESGRASVEEMIAEAERLEKAAAVEEEKARRKRARAAKLRAAKEKKEEEEEMLISVEDDSEQMIIEENMGIPADLNMTHYRSSRGRTDLLDVDAMFFAALDATCIVCGTEIAGRHRWAKHFRAVTLGSFTPIPLTHPSVYCSSTGVRVTVPLLPAPSHPAVRIPADAVTDEWVSERMPEHDQTDLYVFHEPCWRRLVSHFSPTEFDVGFVSEALEYLPLPLLCGHHEPTPTGLKPPYMWEAVKEGLGHQPNYADLDDLMRFAKAPPSPWRPVMSSAPFVVDPFQRLPLELIEMIAVLLPTRDVLHLRQVSRGVASVFSSSAFWKTRFDLNAERGFLWPVVRDIINTAKGNVFDWRLLYHCTCHLTCSQWFRLELKSWEALRWLRDTALALASGAPRPLDYRGDALHYYHNAIIGDTHLEVVDCDSRVLHIAVSAHDDCGSHYGPGSVCITGLEFFFENGPPASLGYTSPGATNIPRKKWRNSQRTKMAHPRVRVMMDLIDFKGIMVTHNLDGGSATTFIMPMMVYALVLWKRSHKSWRCLT